MKHPAATRGGYYFVFAKPEAEQYGILDGLPYLVPYSTALSIAGLRRHVNGHIAVGKLDARLLEGLLHQSCVRGAP